MNRLLSAVCFKENILVVTSPNNTSLLLDGVTTKIDLLSNAAQPRLAHTYANNSVL